MKAQFIKQQSEIQNNTVISLL